METSTKTPRFRHRIDMSILVANVVLSLGTVAVLGGGFFVYSRQIETATMSDNRFLTMEWHLLQRLKTETDGQLKEKDREIAELKRQYRLSTSQETALEIDVKLKRAEAERLDLLSQSLRGAFDPVRVFAQTEVPGPEAPKSTTELLGLQLKALEAQLEESLERTQKAEAELAARKAEPTPLPPALPAPVEPRVTETSEILALLKTHQQTLASPPPPTMEDLKTYSLVRAILRSPQVRTTYPELLESLESYLKVYGQREQQKGQADAYAAVVEAIRALVEVDQGSGLVSGVGADR